MLLKDGVPPWASFGVIWFSMYKSLCAFEFFLKRLATLCPFGSRIIACATQATRVKFDSDSYFIGVDTHASRTLSDRKCCFKDLRPCNLTCDGFADEKGEGAKVEAVGTFCFTITANDGRRHPIEVPTSLYVPRAKMTLLVPQHWAQEAFDHYPTPKGTGFEGDDEGMRLFWGQRQFEATIKLNPATNTPGFQTASGTVNYQCFDAIFQESGDFATPDEHVEQLTPAMQLQRGVIDDSFGDEHLLAPTHVIPPDDVPEGPPTAGRSVGSSVGNRSATPLENQDSNQIRMGPLTFDPRSSDSYGQSHEHQALDGQAELLRWHYRLGHLAFSKLKQLALAGEIPKHLAKVTPPACAGCLYGTMTKIPWRSKISKKDQDNKSEVFEAVVPGQCVSVDQMVSTQLGFFAQMKGRLTKKRYKGATIFIDHFSRVRFTFLMTTDLTSEETVEAKEAFERWSEQHGVRIQHYHCDNGRFADNAFKNHCNENRQRVTYCGVNAHFQNGIAERAIRSTQEQSRKQLFHAKSR